MEHAKYLIGFVFFFLSLNLVSATYSFNEDYNVTYIIKYDTSTHETNITGNFTTYYNEFNYSNYDIFPLDASINDSISFTIPLYKFDNLTLNITQPAIATKLHVVWEYNSYAYYWNGSSMNQFWHPINNVIDNTNNFTTSGLVSVVWNHTAIPNWTIFVGSYFPNAGSNNFRVTQFLVRARITDISGLTQVPHVNYTTKAETYYIKADSENVTPDTLFINSSYYGWNLSDGTPCVRKMNSYYSLMCDLYFSNSNLTIDNNTMFEIGNLSNNRVVVSATASNNFTIGAINNSDNATYQSSYVKYWNNDNVRNPNGGYNDFYGNINVYGSTWLKRAGGFNDPAMVNKVRLRNSIMEAFGRSDDHWYFTSTLTGYVKNLIYYGSQIYFYPASVDVDNFIISMWGSVKSINSGVTGGVVKNTDFGSTYKWTVVNSGVNATCLDCRFNNTALQVVASSTPTQATVNYTFDVLVYNTTGNVNISDFNLTIVDNYGITRYNSTYSGKMSFKTYEEWQNGSTKDYNPYILTISKSGYYPLTQRFNLSYDNRYQTFQLGTYPLNITGALKMNKNGGIYIYSC